MIQVTHHEGITQWCLQDEPCNEIGTEMLQALEDALDALDPTQTRALILHSGVQRGFCAGADLRELYEGMMAKEGAERTEGIRDFIHRIHRVMDRLDTLPFTTIGAIHGVCFGGGFELALTCDVLVADATARFCFPELRLGIVPGFGGIPRLKREVGNAIVRDLLLTGRSINAKKAGNIGLVSQVVARGEALGVAQRVAEQATRFDGETTRLAKAFIKDLPEAELAREKDLFLDMIQRPVVLEALRTFVESTSVRPYLPEAK